MIAAQVFAWLCAQLRVSALLEPQYSDIFIQETLSNPPTTLQILPRALTTVPTKERLCWNEMMLPSVIVRGFPIPERFGEVGLELPFDMMVSLAGILYPIEFENGVVLKGYSSVFLPVSKRESTSIQWHFKAAQTSGKRESIQSLVGEEQFEKIRDLDLLRQAKAFVGLWHEAHISLGTRDSDYRALMRSSGAEIETSGWEVDREFNITVGASKYINFNGQMKLRRRQEQWILNRGCTLDEAIQMSSKQSLLIYDVGLQRSCLVPELNVILHIVLAKMLKDQPLQNLKYVHPSSLDGRSALEAILASLDDTDRFSESINPTHAFARVLKSVFTTFSNRRDEVDKVSGVPIKRPFSGKSSLPGWEFCELMEPRWMERRQFVNVDDQQSGSCYSIATQNPDILVIFGDNLGDIISPRSRHLLCESIQNLPAHSYRMAASVDCLRWIQKKYPSSSGGQMKMTPKLHISGSAYHRFCSGAKHSNPLLNLSDSNRNMISRSRMHGAVVIFGRYLGSTKVFMKKSPSAKMATNDLGPPIAQTSQSNRKIRQLEQQNSGVSLDTRREDQEGDERLNVESQALILSDPSTIEAPNQRTAKGKLPERTVKDFRKRLPIQRKSSKKDLSPSPTRSPPRSDNRLSSDDRSNDRSKFNSTKPDLSHDSPGPQSCDTDQFGTSPAGITSIRSIRRQPAFLDLREQGTFTYRQLQTTDKRLVEKT